MIWVSRKVTKFAKPQRFSFSLRLFASLRETNQANKKPNVETSGFTPKVTAM